MRDDQKTNPALVLIAVVLGVVVTITYIGDRTTNPDRYLSNHSLMATSNPPS